MVSPVGTLADALSGDHDHVALPGQFDGPAHNGSLARRNLDGQRPAHDLRAPGPRLDVVVHSAEYPGSVAQLRHGKLPQPLKEFPLLLQNPHLRNHLLSYLFSAFTDTSKNPFKIDFGDGIFVCKLTEQLPFIIII